VRLRGSLNLSAGPNFDPLAYGGPELGDPVVVLPVRLSALSKA
jgi:hypothetical protein